VSEDGDLQNALQSQYKSLLQMLRLGDQILSYTWDTHTQGTLLSMLEQRERWFASVQKCAPAQTLDELVKQTTDAAIQILIEKVAELIRQTISQNAAIQTVLHQSIQQLSTRIGQIDQSIRFERAYHQQDASTRRSIAFDTFL
jgi:hypothetical protein